MSALLWAIGAGTIGTLAAALWGWFQKSRADGADREAKLQQAFAQNCKRERDAANDARRDDAQRLEAVIAFYKQELAEQDSQMRALAMAHSLCPHTGTTPGGGAVVGLPAGPSSAGVAPDGK